MGEFWGFVDWGAGCLALIVAVVFSFLLGVRTGRIRERNESVRSRIRQNKANMYRYKQQLASYQEQVVRLERERDSLVIRSDDFFTGVLCGAVINPDPWSVVSGFFPDLTDISVIVNRRTPGFKGHRCFNQRFAISDKLCKCTFLLAEYIADSVGGNDPGSLQFPEPFPFPQTAQSGQSP